MLGRIARLGGSAAALTTLGPVVWAQTGNDPPLPAEVAGVKLPLSALVLKAAREVYAEAKPVIYFHSVRTFVLASLYADQEKWAFNRELVMLSSLFHDIAPAAELGLRTVWIDRQGETSDLPRAATLPDLAGLPDSLDALAPG